MQYTPAPLQGTEKQVKWAEHIRHKKFFHINAIYHPLSQLPDIDYRLAWLQSISSSSWWIAHKDAIPYALVAELELQPIRLKRYPLSTPGQVLYWSHSLFGTVILDTETTGLDDQAELVEVAVIDLAGNILLNTLVKPYSPIPERATAIHGITDAMVDQAPTFHEVWPVLYALLCQYRVVIFNAKYDSRIIRLCAHQEKLPFPSIQPDCAMQAYATCKQEINPATGQPKWQKLEVAAKDLGVEVKGDPHRALTDCLTTLGIIRRLGELYEREREDEKTAYDQERTSTYESQEAGISTQPASYDVC